MERLIGLIPRERILVVAGAGLADRLRERLNLPRDNMLVEPRAASTAPALIWATWEAQRRDPDAEVLSLHADWAVGDAAAFRRTADLALSIARRHDRLVTVGMVPSRPETGYGYIVPGAPLDESARTVARFSEKPDAATALDLMAAGALWNSGLFAWTAERLLAEVRAHTPEVAAALEPLERGDVRRLLPCASPRSRSTSACWSEAMPSPWFPAPSPGTTSAPGKHSPACGPRTPAATWSWAARSLHEAHDCIVWSERDTVVLSGVQDLVVVQANGRILVMPTERAASMKQLLDSLPAEVRDIAP